MKDAVILALKALAGGVLVTLFALLSAALLPKRFAGLFGASPAVALAGLAIVLADKGTHPAHQETIGMIAGAVGMLAYSAAIIPLLRRSNARLAAVIALSAWATIAAIVAVPLMLLT